MYCLLTDSPDLFPDEEEALGVNIERVVNEGRKKGLTILLQDKEVLLETWMLKHLCKMQPLAALLDAHHGGNDYRTAVALMQGKAGHSESTISAQVLSDSARLGSLWQLGISLAKQHQTQVLAQTLSPNTQAKYEVLAEKSVFQQADIELDDNTDFKVFLEQYR